MAFVITQSCCADASCVSVCPVNCIHPTPDEPDFGTTDTLYVDPAACIDCGACADACPVKAIQPADLLRGSETAFIDINAQFYETPRDETVWTAPAFTHSGDTDGEPLRVAIVGSGPAASYTAKHLLTTTTCEVSIFERLPIPGGLLREGVAPDHGGTKALASQFRWVYAHPRTTTYFNVEVGRDVSLAELKQRFHAVIYGVGARAGNPIGFIGEESTAVVRSGDVVGWYNGRPAEEGREPFAMPLDKERVVIVGNGNVALDIARTLLAPVDSLHLTDMPAAVLDQLRHSKIREVVVMGRRAPRFAAFTRPELLMLPETAGCDVVVEDRPGVREELAELTEARHRVLAQMPVVPIDLSAAPEPGRRIVLSFHTTVDEVVEGMVTLRRTVDPAAGTGEEETLPIGPATVVLANGFRVAQQAGLPYDETVGRIPQADGRAIDPTTGDPIGGVYLVGWAKRGAQGGLGTNKHDSENTIHAMLTDAHEGKLNQPTMSRLAFWRLLRGRTDVINARRALNVLDREEKAGRKNGRPREKFVSTQELMAASRLRRRRDRSPVS